MELKDPTITVSTSDKSHKARTRRLEEDEEQRLLLKANDQLKRIIILTLETGLRRGEILNFKKSDINHSISVLLMQSTKANVPRTILLKCCFSGSYRPNESVSKSQMWVEDCRD